MSTIDNPEQIENFRILLLRAALKLEIAGLRRSRGLSSAYALIKREFGFKGSNVKCLTQLDSYIRDNNLSALDNPEGGEPNE